MSLISSNPCISPAGVGASAGGVRRPANSQLGPGADGSREFLNLESQIPNLESQIPNFGSQIPTSEIQTPNPETQPTLNSGLEPMDRVRSRILYEKRNKLKPFWQFSLLREFLNISSKEDAV